MPASAPVERKVQASSAAAAASGLALWALGRYVFRGAVPDVVTSWTYAAVPGALAFAAGYYARHTSRPVLPPLPAPECAPGAAYVTPGQVNWPASGPLEPEFVVQGLPAAAEAAPSPEQEPPVPSG